LNYHTMRNGKRDATPSILRTRINSSLELNNWSEQKMVLQSCKLLKFVNSIYIIV
jgi:hypothetical protein